jgi:hypothetical protein
MMAEQGIHRPNNPFRLGMDRNTDRSAPDTRAQ